MHACKIRLVLSDRPLCNPAGHSPMGSSVHGYSRQEYRSGLQFPPPGELPDPGIKPGSPTLQPDSLPTEFPGEGSSTIQERRWTQLTGCLTPVYNCF